MIEVKELTKYYGPRTAVDGISFSVPRGQILGFLGPNGAGKSTTMRILTGYLAAQRGSATVAGFDVFSDSIEVRRRIGYLPETNPLYPEMRVSGYLKLACKLRGVPPQKRAGRIDYAIEACGLGERRHDVIGRLSKGLRQRVGLAQAVVHDPDVLILDEPTSGLDPGQTRETRDLIRELGRQHTVILSTHILPEVSATCERVVIINQGRLVADDTPANLSRRLSQGRGLEIEMVLRGDPEAIRRKLAAVRSVSKVEVDAAADGQCRVLITSDDADPREELARTAIRSGFGLLSLQSRTLSLEDVFIYLTTEEPPPSPD